MKAQHRNDSDSLAIIPFPSLTIQDAALVTLPAVQIQMLHGEQDSYRLSAIANDWLATRDLLFSLALMCAPDDLERAITLTNTLTDGELYAAVHYFKDLGLKTMVEGDVALAFSRLEDPTRFLLNLVNSDWLAHIICGFILRRVVSIHRNKDTKGSASIAEAIEVAKQWCDKHKLKGGGVANIKINIWPKYKSVSHFWAAWFMLNDTSLQPSRIGMPRYMEVLLGTAQWLAEQAFKIEPKHGRTGEAVLSPDQVWMVPPELVPRKDDGTPANACWMDELGAHDLRNQEPPSFLEPV